MGKEDYNEIKVDGMTIGVSSTDNTAIEGNITLGTTTTSSSLIFNSNTSEIKTISFEFKQTDDGNFIEVVKRQEPNPNITYTIWPSQNEVARVWKEVYGVSEKNELVLIKTIEGNLTPGHYVEEDISFNE